MPQLPCVRRSIARGLVRVRHDAQIQIIEYKSIICPGFSCVLHVHSIVEDVTITHLIAIKDKKTGKPLPGPVKFVREGQTVFARLKVPRPVCVETFEDFDQFGRFMLRDEGTPSPAVARARGGGGGGRDSRAAAGGSPSLVV